MVWTAISGTTRHASHRRLCAGAILAAPLLFASPAGAANAPAGFTDLYAATVIVTGRDNLAERQRGIREALPLVLAKVAADAAIGGKAVANGLGEIADSMVERFDYVDRKQGIQISDEQGTRERSFELTVRFAPARIDALIAEFGGKPWKDARPGIVVLLSINDGNSEYLLTQISAKGYGQRLALDATAKALALPIALPKAEDGATAENPAAAPARLEGIMEMTPAGYWNTQWRFVAVGIDERFAFQNTTFDIAIAGALDHCAKTLANR